MKRLLMGGFIIALGATGCSGYTLDHKFKGEGTVKHEVSGEATVLIDNSPSVDALREYLRDCVFIYYTSPDGFNTLSQSCESDEEA